VASPIGRRPSPPRRTIVITAAGAGISVIAVFAIYFLLPLDGKLSVRAGTGLLVAVVAFVLIGVAQVKSVVRSPYPAMRALQVLAVLIPVFIVVFATYYYVVARQTAASFNTELSRVDALYFTVTVLATVGFGDIVAKSEAARIAVTVQMVADLAVLGVLVRTAARAVAHGWDRQSSDAAGASPATGDAAYSEPAEHR
jgi:voltage-gated potassium channel